MFRSGLKYTRFLTVALAMCAPIVAHAGPDNLESRESVATNISYQMPLRLRVAGPNEKPVAAEGLRAELFAQGLGNISALVRGADGNIYVLSQDKGQVLALSDRNLDGQIDMTRIVAKSMNNPISMVEAGGYLYVVDSGAIWKIDIKQQNKSEFVSLRNVTARPDIRPMILHPNSGHLLLALSENSGQARLLSIDLKSGLAREIAKGEGPVQALAMIKGTPLWAASKDRLFTVSQNGFQDNSSHVPSSDQIIQNIYLPGQGDMTAPGLENIVDQFLIVVGQDFQALRGRKHGRTVLTVPGSFGQPSGEPETILQGFVDPNGRSAWGEPGAMIWDERGLFVADRQSGTIWLVSKVLSSVKSSAQDDQPFRLYELDEVKKPKASWGSSIKSGSQIITGSSLSGSWEDDKLTKSGTLMEKLRQQEEEEMSGDDD